jgi:hypothetical protein
MPSVMADHDVEGQVRILPRILMSDDWLEFWRELGYQIASFASLGIATNIADIDLWRLCQERDIVLITGNRNKEGPASLEATIEQLATPESLPVLTIGEPHRIFSSCEYAHLAAERLLAYLARMDYLRGTGRLFLP